uniref:Fibronectin type-III domain-containing protein n=1 Tax=Tetranychus urticae TaxID=32264 RepID=T1KU51_TETUR
MIGGSHNAQNVLSFSRAAPKWILKPLERYSTIRGSKLIGVVSGPHIHVSENGSLVIIDSTEADEGILGSNGVNGMKIGRELIPSSSHHSFLSSSRFQINQDVNGNRVISHVTLDSPLVEDSGTFICTASNSYGKAEKTVHLIVQGPPRSPRNLRSVEVASRDITIVWEAPDDGNSPILDYLIQYTYNNGAFIK